MQMWDFYFCLFFKFLFPLLKFRQFIIRFELLAKLLLHKYKGIMKWDCKYAKVWNRCPKNSNSLNWVLTVHKYNYHHIFLKLESHIEADSDSQWRSRGMHILFFLRRHGLILLSLWLPTSWGLNFPSHLLLCNLNFVILNSWLYLP